MRFGKTSRIGMIGLTAAVLLVTSVFEVEARGRRRARKSGCCATTSCGTSGGCTTGGCTTTPHNGQGQGQRQDDMPPAPETPATPPAPTS